MYSRLCVRDGYKVPVVVIEGTSCSGVAVCAMEWCVLQQVVCAATSGVH